MSEFSLKFVLSLSLLLSASTLIFIGVRAPLFVCARLRWKQTEVHYVHRTTFTQKWNRHSMDDRFVFHCLIRLKCDPKCISFTKNNFSFIHVGYDSDFILAKWWLNVHVLLELSGNPNVLTCGISSVATKFGKYRELMFVPLEAWWVLTKLCSDIFADLKALKLIFVRVRNHIYEHSSVVWLEFSRKK